MEDKKVLVECDCGCGILKFQNLPDDDIEEIFISYYEDGFYSHQLKLWDGIRNYFSRLYKALIGKDYFLYELILHGDNLNKFKKDMEEFIRAKEKFQLNLRIKATEFLLQEIRVKSSETAVGSNLVKMSKVLRNNIDSYFKTYYPDGFHMDDIDN
jgi:hypothetical protein